ncbi:MAG: site-specific integrase [Candidatus Eremiobacteraeota bacterium]|nr:site-specific integrase [Candidatus Eremiobacteraeota bacterium]
MRGSLSRLGENKYRIIYDLPKGIDGKRRQKTETVYGNKKAADATLSDRLITIQKGDYSDSGRQTVDNLFERFLESNESRLAATTRQRYASILKNHIKPELGKIALSQLSPLHLEQAYAKWVQRGRIREAGGLSHRTVLHYHRLLHRVLAQAVKWKLVTRNVADAVNPPRPVHREMRALSEQEVAKLVESLDQPSGHVIAQGGFSSESSFPVAIKCALYTGCRLGELLGLKWEDLDSPGGSIVIRRSLQEVGGTVFVKETKTRKSRVISIPPYLVQVFQTHKAQQNTLRLALGEAYRDDGFIFARSDGSPIRPQMMSQAAKALFKRLNVNCRLHDLRHTHATLLLKSGVSSKVASSRLGHASVGITLDLYAHVLPGMDEEAASKFEALIAGAATVSTKSAR